MEKNVNSKWKLHKNSASSSLSSSEQYKDKVLGQVALKNLKQEIRNKRKQHLAIYESININQ